MLPQQYCLRWKYHQSNLQNMFSQLLDRGCFCDVTLACEERQIRAHRVVLCACSSFFDAILTNYASERDPIIILKDVSFVDVKSLIDFMYKGEINVEYANLASLLRTADDLKIKGLAEVSWRGQSDDLTPLQSNELSSHMRETEPFLCNYQQQQQQQLQQQLAFAASKEQDQLRVSPAYQPHTARPALLSQNGTDAAGNGVSATTVATNEQYLGPKRKRGRPPLDDSYDVFNVRNNEKKKFPMEADSFGDNDAQSNGIEQLPTESQTNTVAEEEQQQQQQLMPQYQSHKYRFRQKQQQQQHQQQRDLENLASDKMNGHHHEDAESSKWSNGPLEVHALEKEHAKSRNHNNSIEDSMVNGKDISVEATNPTNSDELDEKHQVDVHDDKESTMLEVVDAAMLKQELDSRPTKSAVPQTVEEIENVQLEMDKQLSARNSNESASTTTRTDATTAASMAALQQAQFGKYMPDAYLMNEHGMMLQQDLMNAAAAAAAMQMAADLNGSRVEIASSTDTDYADNKMDDYDAADFRLTSEELSEWQDVIKMDDYLAKGRRPQFWEEPFTRRVLDAIKNKRLEMKKAARILGVSYGTLYGRYREVYGCLKHPYSGSTPFRSTLMGTVQSVQSRFDLGWRPMKREEPLLPPALDISKLKRKDLSELWTRPQT